MLEIFVGINLFVMSELEGYIFLDESNDLAGETLEITMDVRILYPGA